MSKVGNIVFVINSLEGGGAERVLARLLESSEHHAVRYRLHLVLLDQTAEQHRIPAWVEKHVLGAQGGLPKSIVRLTRTLRRLKPVAIVSFLTRSNMATIIASELLGSPCIISERVNTTSHFSSKTRSNKISKALIRATYRRAEHIIAVSQGVKQDLVTNFGARSERTTVIYNPVYRDLIGLQAGLESMLDIPGPYLIAIGRLTANKNFSLLLEAYHRSNIPEQLLILGEGPERPRLEATIEKLGLGSRVRLAGYVSNPYPLLRGARYYVSSSNAEGFPNAMVEAMALGRPVLATDCDSGPLEILFPDREERVSALTEAPFGILVPVEDAECLGEGLRLMSHAATQQRYSEASLRRARDFDPVRSVEHYWDVIRSVAAA